MREITYAEAIREALEEEMKKDQSIFFMGEDIAIWGGAFGVSRGMIDKFGAERIRNTPMSEAAIVGVATGAAMNGMRPIVEIMFMDFITLTLDQLLNHATVYRYVSQGQYHIPLVIRTPAGGGRGYGATHSKSMEPLLLSIPGLKIVYPSNAYDAKGLLKSAIRDNNPVVFIENKLLYAKKMVVPEEEYYLPLGKASIVREGKDVTIITYSRMIQEALAAVAETGINAEIVDVRTLFPLDIKTIAASVKKTRKAIVIEESYRTGGVGAEISSLIVEHCFDYLDAPIQRIGAKEVPIPCTPVLESIVIPSKNDIIKALEVLR